jgi:AraC-like DNA-binding protein
MNRLLQSPSPQALRIQSDDLDEVRSWTDKLSGRHSRVVHGKGPLGFEMTVREGHRVDVSGTRVKLEQTVRGSLPQDCLHVAFEGRSRYTFGRRQLDISQQQAVLVPQGWEFTRRSEPIKALALRLRDPAWRADVLARWPDVALDAVAHPRRLELQHPAHHALQAAIGELTSAAADPATGAAQWRLCEARLVDALGDALWSTSAWARTSAVDARRIARLEDWIDAHLGEPITIGQLCQVAGVGDRSLQNAFVQRRGTTPMRFVAERRLAVAHRRLLAATPIDSVSQIALEVGFSHLGRFATLYRQAYGETPSQTLQQRRIGLFQVPRRANFGGNGGSGGHTRARVLAAA